MTITAKELEELERLAKEATPGDWFADYGKIGVGDNGIGEMDDVADAAYIAAADPQTVLALLDRIEELESGAERPIDEERLARAIAATGIYLDERDGHELPGPREFANNIAVEYGVPKPAKKRIDWSNVVVDEGDEAP